MEFSSMELSAVECSSILQLGGITSCTQEAGLWIWT